MRRVLLWARSNEDTAWIAAARDLASKQFPTLRPAVINASAFDPRDDLELAHVVAVVVQPGQDAIATAYRARGCAVYVSPPALQALLLVTPPQPVRAVPFAATPPRLLALDNGRPSRRRMAS